MGRDGGKFGRGRSDSDGDLELLRERVLDHPDEEEALRGPENNNELSTGPIKVIVKQDGIGRTGGIIVACFAGTALGIAVMAVVLMSMRDRDHIDDIAQIRMESRISQEKLNKLEPRVNQLEKPHAEF